MGGWHGWHGDCGWGLWLGTVALWHCGMGTFCLPCIDHKNLIEVRNVEMPRRAREKSSTGIYHVILRGINRFKECVY